jgi:hypothetical protein
MKKQEKEKFEMRATKLKEYLFAIEQGNFEFSIDLENETIGELEELAKVLAIWYSEYDSPEEKLLDFVLQTRVRKLNEQFVFNPENTDKIIRLDRQLHDFFTKLKKEADDERSRLKEKMSKDNDIDQISVDFELTNIVFSNGNKGIFHGSESDYDLFLDNPFFKEFNRPCWKTIYYKTDTYKTMETALAKVWDEIPLFDLSTKQGINSRFNVHFETDENNRKWVTRNYAEPVQCKVGNAFLYIYEQGNYTLSEMLSMEEIWCYINNVEYKTKVLSNK